MKCTISQVKEKPVHHLTQVHTSHALPVSVTAPALLRGMAPTARPVPAAAAGEQEFRNSFAESVGKIQASEEPQLKGATGKEVDEHENVVGSAEPQVQSGAAMVATKPKVRAVVNVVEKATAIKQPVLGVKDAAGTEGVATQPATKDAAPIQAPPEALSKAVEVDVPAIGTPVPTAGDEFVAPESNEGKPSVVKAVGTSALTKGVAAHASKKNDAVPTAPASESGVTVTDVAVRSAPHTTEQHASTESVVAVSTPTVHAVHTSTTSVSGVSAKAEAVAAPMAEMTASASDLKTMVATPNVLEVGVASGSHGWLRVRAEFGQAGEVAASVVAATAGAAEGLHKELPAISAYLAGERVGVSSLVVNAAERGAGTQEALVGAGVGSQANAGSGGSGQRGKDVATSPVPRIEDMSVTQDAGVGLLGMSLPAAVFANGSGSWLSVRV